MRVDRKLLLILPTVVLVLLSAGLFYTATRLRLIVSGSDDLPRRAAIVGSLERGERRISMAQAIGIIRVSIEAEQNRTAAIDAVHDLVQLVAWITAGCCVALIWGIRQVPRERAVSRPAPEPPEP